MTDVTARGSVFLPTTFEFRQRVPAFGHKPVESMARVRYADSVWMKQLRSARMPKTCALIFLATTLSTIAFCSDWDPALAAKYLDDRQKQWFEWSITKASGGPCVSCHTSLPYLLARPHLRKALSETGKTEFERGLLDGLQVRLRSGETMFKSF